MYILDTSSLRNISKSFLEEASKEHEVAISTITVFELASHLNDSIKHEDYVRLRGNFLKCKVLKIIDDPFWRFSQKLGLSANLTRKDDTEMHHRLLALVESSYTQESLSMKQLEFPDGDIISCRNIGTRLAETLKNLEDDYVRQIRRFAYTIGLDPSLNGKHELTSESLLKVINDSVKRSVSDDFPVRQKEIFCATAVYMGYMLSRLYWYANALPRNESNLRIDGNDCEDSYFCLNLDLNGSDILVTDDKGTIAAVKETLHLLNSVLPEKFNEDRIINSQEFQIRTQLS